MRMMMTLMMIVVMIVVMIDDNSDHHLMKTMAAWPNCSRSKDNCRSCCQGFRYADPTFETHFPKPRPHKGPSNFLGPYSLMARHICAASSRRRTVGQITIGSCLIMIHDVLAHRHESWVMSHSFFWKTCSPSWFMIHDSWLKNDPDSKWGIRIKNNKIQDVAFRFHFAPNCDQIV